jgi:hypothetical protein
MAIDKALNQAPLGLSEMVEDMEPAIEIEIEDPESVSIKAGDLEIVKLKKKIWMTSSTRTWLKILKTTFLQNLLAICLESISQTSTPAKTGCRRM